MDEENLTTRKDLAAYFKKLEEVQEKGIFPFTTLGTCLRWYWWQKRVPSPLACPRCLSRFWATRRKNRQGMRPGT